ncbi:MAG: NAD(+)/NADH kinase [Planctomycetes bacterium]|nr:NAD(+)/NADH kinase [Planctomycetota bacterium]
MTDDRYVQVVVNPVSGRSSSEPIVAALVQHVEAMGSAARVHRTTGPGDGARVVAACRPEECRALVVVGGDGTVREVATSVRPGVPIVIVPRGTENLVAKYLGMTADVDSAARLLREGVPLDIDIAEARWTNRAKKFLLVGGVGFDAEVVRMVHGGRRGHITHLSYVWPILKTLLTFRHPSIRVETDDGVQYEGRGMVFVGNIPRYAIGLRLVPKADPQDGLLDVCAFECASRLRLIRHALMVVLGRHVGSRGVHYSQTRSVRVSAAGHVEVEIDGDLAEPLPVEFSMTGERARFLVSPDWRA